MIDSIDAQGPFYQISAFGLDKSRQAIQISKNYK